ncbi:hypothetical protein MTO96_021230 [Rhipicephalus appendiculatus]
MRCALFLAAWTVALAVAEPALDPWLQALYGRRRLQKKDVRLLKAKVADDYGGSQAAGAYEYGADYAPVPASSLLGRMFQSADLDYYDDEPTTLYCITVTPKPHTTQSTTPEVICFPPSRRPRTRTTTRTTTTTAAPAGNCENDEPQPPAHKVSPTTTARPHHTHSGRPNCTTNRHHQGHPEAVECIPEEHEKAHHVPSTSTHASSARSTAKTHPSTAKTSTISPPHAPEACEEVPQTVTTTTRRTAATPPAPKTRPPVDEFLAAWGYFKHHNSLDPHNASHWREFHGVNGPHAPRRRDVAKRNDVVVIMPPWLRQPAHPGLAFVVPPAQPLARHLSKREQQPPRPGLTFVVPPVEPGARLVKREEQPNGSSAAPYQVYWFSSWPPAGREVSRLPGRDKANFVKLADWWQDVIKTYNGHHRKKRGLQRR